MTNLSKNAKTDVLVHVVGEEEASKRKVVQQLQEPENSKKSHPFWTGKLLDDEGLNFRQLLLLTGLAVGAVCLSTVEHKPSCVHIEGNNNTVVVEGVSAEACVASSRVKP